MKIIIFGPIGSGKGTISQELEKNHQYIHIALGDILREEIKKESPLGLKVKQIVESGNLVDNKTISEVAELALARIPHTKSIILDGFPRTLVQAQYLEDISKKLNIVWNKAVYLNIAKEKVIDRLLNRRVCSHCGYVYNKKFGQVPEDNKCIICGHQIIQRKDDNLGTINIRFDNYFKQTQPLKDYYAKKNMLQEIDANAVSSKLIADIID